MISCAVSIIKPTEDVLMPQTWDQTADISIADTSDTEPKTIKTANNWANDVTMDTRRTGRSFGWQKTEINKKPTPLLSYEMAMAKLMHRKCC